VFRRRGVEIKTPEQISHMRSAGLVVASTLRLVRAESRPGVTTAELDVFAEAHIRDSGATPSFQGYHGFPASICVSVNDEIVHGIPRDRVLRDGDIVSVDCGAIVAGWHADAALSFVLGEPRHDIAALLAVCEDAMWAGVAAVLLGGRRTVKKNAVESVVRSRGDLGIVEDYVGHGIGSQLHQPPSVPNRGRPGKGPRLVEGIALAVEPMLTLGSPETRVLADDWTVVTADGTPAAHFEHTVTVTERGPWVLTELDGGLARLAELGVAYGGEPVSADS